MSETELLEAFTGHRSEEAFAELVRRYAGLVYSTAKRRLANAALAEDITQIVFIRFANQPPRVRNPAELAAWLHRTTINVTIDLWRSETRRRKRELEAVIMEPTAHETSVWEDISPKLDEALNQLANADRHALLLRFFGRKTMREVGSALGVSEDAAKMRVSRAVDRLRTQMGVGGATCTVATLGALLVEHSVEAAPGQLVARLASIKLPVAAGVVGLGGWLEAFLQISRWKLAAGAVVLAVIAVGTVHLVRSLNAPMPPAALANSQIIPTNQIAWSADAERFNFTFHPTGFNPAQESPQANGKMVFHVLDAETGEPLAGATIHAAYFGAGGQGESHDFLTDRSGAAAIPEPADKTMNVFVVATDHVPKAVMFRQAGAATTDYTLKLDPAITVGGVVINRQNQPVAGVKIMIQTPGIKPGQIENVDFQTCLVTSDQNGHWTYSYVPKDYTDLSYLPVDYTNLVPSVFRVAGMIPFILKKEGYAGTVVNVPVTKMDVNNLILMIDRGYAVTGRVTDSQNRPIASAEIKTLDGDPNKCQSTETDENGIFTLTGLSCNNKTGPKWTYQQTALETNDSGAVIAESGHSFYGFFRFTMETNDGNASVVPHFVPWPEKAPPPEATVAVQAEGFAPQTCTVTFSENTNFTEFRLSPGKIFRGRVVDEAGNPISNAVVQTDWDFKNQIPTQFDWTAHTDGTGRFEWDSAPATEICYWFEAEGYNAIRGRPILADGSDHEITLKSKVVK